MNKGSNIYKAARMRPYDAIIVGAGCAGLAAGVELYEKNKKFIIFEAENSIGGRVSYLDKYGDLGAACFHLPDNILTKPDIGEEMWGPFDIVKFGQDNNFKFTQEYNKFVFFRNGKKLPEGKVNAANDKIRSAIEKGLRHIAEEKKDISLHDALSPLFKDDICRSLIHTIYSTTDAGLDAKDISLTDYCDTLPSNPGLFPNKGMGTLLKSYAKKIEDKISLNKEVLKISRDQSGHYAVTFMDTETDNIQTVFAKNVIVTVSVGVLQDWIKEERIILNREKQQAINNIQMGHLNKNILVMEEKFFDYNNITDFTHINIRSNKLNRDANFLSRPNGKPILVNFIGGKQSLEYEHYGKSYARDKALQVLASVYGHSVFDMCEDSYLTKWDLNKYYKGAYSATSVHNSGARAEYSRPEGRIYFAGEAYDHPLRTHTSGALYSGRIVAHNVMRDLDKRISL